MFRRNGEEIMTFRVYDSIGTCINEFTGTMSEWQRDVAPILAPAKLQRDEPNIPSRLN
jgi:hypothetical protein